MMMLNASLMIYSGKHAVGLLDAPIFVGKPIASLLLQADCTVTVVSF